MLICVAPAVGSAAKTWCKKRVGHQVFENTELLLGDRDGHVGSVLQIDRCDLGRFCNLCCQHLGGESVQSILYNEGPGCEASRSWFGGNCDDVTSVILQVPVRPETGH